MVLQEFKCQHCNHRFEAEVLDDDEPQERNRRGSPLRCPVCNYSLLEILRTVRRRIRRAS